jgi:sarcosine oxidase subunit beta
VKQSLPEKADVVVIGGGLLGTSVAYQLAKLGVSDVLLLERGNVGAQGATAKCLGGWRVQFATKINVCFSVVSKVVFDRFEEEFGVDPNFVNSGYLYLTGSNHAQRIFESTAGMLESMKLKAEVLAPAQIAERWPYLRVDDLVAACWTPGDGYYGPNEVVQGYARGARRLGVTILEETEIAEILTDHGRLAGVKTADGKTVRTDWVVNAAGPWSGQVAALAGLDLPVGPLRRHLFMTDVFEQLPAAVPFILHFDSGWYTRREGTGLLLAGPADNRPEQRTFSEKVDFEAEEWTALQSVRRIPALRQAHIFRGWIGHYALSPDHHAVIGAYPELQGFVVCSGFSGHGFQHSPAAGIVTSELIVHGRPSTLDIHPFRPTRFREGDLIEEPLTSFRDD